VWRGFTWLKIGIVGGCCEFGDEPSGSGATELVFSSVLMLKCKEFSSEPNTYSYRVP
jgi:hypothetical protein